MKLLKLLSPSWIARTRRLRKSVCWQMEPGRGSVGTRMPENHWAALEAVVKDVGAKLARASIERKATMSATAHAVRPNLIAAHLIHSN